VFTVASKFLTMLQRRPALLVALLVVVALIGAKAGAPHVTYGLWDGPI
jgi:hypothetical protein